MIKQVIEFLRNGIWQINDQDQKNPRLRWLLRQFKIFAITTKGFGTHSLNVRSAALTFYTLMGLVPIAAVVFGVIKGFGLSDSFIETLHSSMPQYNTLIDYIIEFADNLIERTKGGWLMAIGSLIFLWAIIRVFSNIESAFNHIWEVHNSRHITRKLSDYLTVIILAPLLWLGSNSLALYLKTTIAYYTGNAYIEILYTLASFFAAWVMFTFVYKMMPNTKVRFSCAINAGVVSGTIFQIFQIAYFYIQSKVSGYNAIYGSFAALPLFLIWLQASWQILLFGAELSYAYQNIHNYEQERELKHISLKTRMKVMVAIMVDLIRNFKQNNGALDTETLAQRLDLPNRLVCDVIFDLETAALVCAVKDNNEDKISKYIPARDINSITVSEVMLSVQNTGKQVKEMGYSQEVAKISEQIDKLEDIMNSSNENKLLIDLI
ncbi:MAG: YihY/virulence factor BrkB family protein [Rikenellaceae bacterium]